MTSTARARSAWLATLFALVPLWCAFFTLPRDQWLTFFAQAIAMLMFTACFVVASILSLTAYWGAAEAEEL